MEDATVPGWHQRCNQCQKIIPTGIITISEHWVNCEGKGFSDALIASRNKKGAALLPEDIEKIR